MASPRLSGLTRAPTLLAMDGLGRSVGDGITGLVGGALAGIGAALSGIVDSLGRALPQGALPVIGAAFVILVVIALLRR